MDGFKMDYLLADKGYDSDAIVAHAQAQGAQAVIPPRPARTASTQDVRQRALQATSPGRERLPASQAVAGNRYALRENVASFAAAVQIRGLALWLHIS
jgi:hypothetical protein